MEKKILGILGGMGAEASDVFYHKIIDATKVEKDQDHIDLMLWSHASIPDRTAMIKEGRTEELWKVFSDDIDLLQRVGCSYLAVPCNTSHYFQDHFRKKMGDGFVNMIDNAAAYAAVHCGKKIGVLATDGTVQSDLYGKALAGYGAECVYPDEYEQSVVMSIIYDEIKKGEKGSLERFLGVLDTMKGKGCDAVILACTELSVLKNNYIELQVPYCLDALDVLTKKCVQLCGGTYCGNL